MPTYISLLRYTQQGIMDAKNGPARLDAAKEGFRRCSRTSGDEGKVGPPTGPRYY